MKILKVNPLNPAPELLKEAASVILNDGVIGYPTETVYGLGANALSAAAIAKVFRLKQRDPQKPILILAHDLDQLRKLVIEFSPIAELLAQAFWPGPLTMIFKAEAHLDKQLMGTGNTIGIRIPANRICLELMQLCGVPLTSTSANLAGGKNPISATEVTYNFKNKLDLIIDGGIARSRMPSTVLDLSVEKPVIRRPGLISKKSIERIIGIKLNENKKKE